MTIRLGIVMDPIQSISYKKDTSLAMLMAARERGWQLFYMEQSDLYLNNGEAMGLMRELTVAWDPSHWYDFGAAHDQPLAKLDVILMRKDPPFDNEYIYSTYILEAAEQAGVLVVNKPQSLRDCNEKLFATQFPQCCPPLVVSNNPAVLKRFHREHGDVILKPLDGMGGASIFRLRHDDPNLSVVIETLTGHGRTPIMAQRFIPEIVNGDKRILLIDGVPVDYCLARIPQGDEFRGNLAAGGRGEARPLSERDRWIAAQVGPALAARGMRFVGLDVIGDWLTEVNVTSPTCIREIDAAYGTNIAGLLFDAIERGPVASPAR